MTILSQNILYLKLRSYFQILTFYIKFQEMIIYIISV